MPLPLETPLLLCEVAPAFLGGGAAWGWDVVCAWLLVDTDCDAALRFLDCDGPFAAVALLAGAGMAGGGSLALLCDVPFLLSSTGAGFGGAGLARSAPCEMTAVLDFRLGFFDLSSRLSG